MQGLAGFRHLRALRRQREGSTLQRSLDQRDAFQGYRPDRFHHRSALRSQHHGAAPDLKCRDQLLQSRLLIGAR